MPPALGVDATSAMMALSYDLTLAQTLNLTHLRPGDLFS